ncbi:nicotinamide mononucleotide deamidase-related protein [Pyrobaculum neutrophilum]|uniref:Molybdopterin binding domain n=1 Tax=Pyrobaculum neutrophilum (strain DSM 2338 / JCM 9278 / NBRC 100436 / V24Sta) TaxID=444157 RepID=B1YA72_PYRNV|nr:nicotinamide mononucleotide deamidase-related protein [Pyrobaculum neutrophilum]ACB39046.1 molybdopterin binding domain [Pyrobaculum neutrophilum V24Sta]
MHKGAAWIVTVGNELLIGRVVNTNASWLAGRLTYLGYAVRRIVTVPDVEEDIAEVFREALARADVVVSTGGLGPTPDDITNIAFCRALGVDPAVNEEALRMVEERYRSRGYPLTPERVKMAQMPPGARPLPNPVGTAPGVLYEAGGKVVVLLPGVPREMEAIFEGYVEPLLKSRGPPVFFAERGLEVRGVPEADVAPIIREVLRLDPRIYVKSHPRGREVEAPLLYIHVYASAFDRGEADRLVDAAVGRLVQLLKARFGGAVSISEERRLA